MQGRLAHSGEGPASWGISSAHAHWCPAPLLRRDAIAADLLAIDCMSAVFRAREQALSGYDQCMGADTATEEAHAPQHIAAGDGGRDGVDLLAARQRIDAKHSLRISNTQGSHALAFLVVAVPEAPKHAEPTQELA